MKILIIGSARSGTTTLLNAFVKVLGLKKFGEPWNKGLRGDKILPWPFTFPTNCVVKTLIEHKPDTFIGTYEEFYLELIKQFDKVIILSRKDKKEALISWTYAFEYNRDNHTAWHKPYTPDISNLDLNKYLADINNIYALLNSISKTVDIETTWYEDLYSGDKIQVEKILKKWGINIDYLKFYSYINPEKRYRYGNSPLI